MASEKLRDMLNKAIAGEIAVSIQYMWQLFEQILAEEENHHNTFQTLLGI